jgi:hypothetical protein
MQPWQATHGAAFAVSAAPLHRMDFVAPNGPLPLARSEHRDPFHRALHRSVLQKCPGLEAAGAGRVARARHVAREDDPLARGEAMRRGLVPSISQRSVGRFLRKRPPQTASLSLLADAEARSCL